MLGMEKRKNRRQGAHWESEKMSQDQHSPEQAMSMQPHPEAVRHEAHHTDELIAALALEVWRLQRRVDRMARDLGEESVRSLRDSLQRLNDVMADHHLELQIHDGQRYVEGSTLEVIHIRNSGDPMIVVETLQPTIRYPERILRVGQVILGAADDVEVPNS
jgi:hypothetical protein